MSWTEERADLLKKLWGEGKTAAEIAQELGEVTRNAVIGKAHRLKLSNRVSPIQQNTKKVAVVAPVVEACPEVEAPASKGEGYSLAELKERMCRWPSGDPRLEGFHFCGAEGVPGLPYCEKHAKLAYQSSSRTRVLQAEDFVDNPKPSDTDEMKENVG